MTKQKVKVLNGVPKEEKRELAIRGSFNIEKLLIMAIKQEVPVDTMERLLIMRKDLKAEAAKEAFDNDMAKLQSEMPIIKKSKPGGKTNTGQVAYYYAPLDSIVFQTRKPISDHGFSYQIKTKTKIKTFKATCIVKHKLGHSEETSMEIPYGTKTNVMSDSQVTAAAATFAKRYAFCNAFGIMTGDEDVDGAIQSVSQTPKKATKTPTLKETMNMVKQAIKEAKDSGQIIEIDTKTQKSVKFSKAFKAEIKKLANDKVNEIDK